MRTFRRLVTTAALVAPAFFAGSALAPPLDAQTVNTDSLRQAYRAQVAEQRRQLDAAAVAFTDRGRSAAQRLAAVEAVAAFDERRHLEATMRVAYDAGEPVELRIRAFELAGHWAVFEPDVSRQLYAFAADASQDVRLRRAAVQQIERAALFTHGGQDHHAELHELARRLARDQDPEIRLAALGRLAAWRDPETMQLLEAGLRSPDRALIAPVHAVQLLGLVDASPHFPVLRQVVAQPPDPATRIMALHFLGPDQASRRQLVNILQNPNESLDARQAALGALRAGDPANFPAHVLPVVTDEGAPVDLRLRAITAVEYQRVTRDQQVSARRLDAFDVQMDQLAERSRDPQVRAAAARYVTRTRSPH